MAPMRGPAFVCTDCEYQAAQWLGRCPHCGSWGSFVEREAGAADADATDAAPQATAQPFPDIPTSQALPVSTGIAELDRVLGGGLVPGAAILIGGEPGIGKSTLLLQAATGLAESGRRVLYVSGEESASQLRLRGERLGVSSKELWVLADDAVESILEQARQHSPAAIIVDSIQAVRCNDVNSLPGSVAQIRESASRLVLWAKQRSVPLILVGHVTKEGALAGPRVLEHLVDTVVQFEGDRHHAHRVLRASKNRFGATDELGVFQMTEHGLREVSSPSEFFLAERSRGVPGSVVLAAVEGTRPVLVELQALVGDVSPGTPRRTALGVDPGRVALILAVLQRKNDVELANRDVFVNVTGGLTINEPASDVAVAAATLSSLYRRPLPEGWVVAGELGLTGEIRTISHPEARLREAQRLGFRGALIPASNIPAQPDGEIQVLPVRHLSAAIEWMFPRAQPPQAQGALGL